MLEKLRAVEWAMTKLKALVKELNCGSLERIPLNALLKCIQDACLNTTVGLLTSGQVGAKVLLNLSLTNAKLTPPEHIEHIELQYQNATQQNDEIMAELALSSNAEHERAIKEYQAKLNWREIARNLAKEFNRIEELQHFAATFNDAAAKCASSDDITALLNLASTSASTFSTPAKPTPSSRVPDADDADAANLTTEHTDGFKLERKAAKKAAHAAKAAANHAKVATLLQSKEPWTIAERSLVLKINTKDGTFSRQTDLCPSCNKRNCPPGKCTTGKGYERWKQKTGNTDVTTQRSARRDPQKWQRNERDPPTCFDFQKGKCQRGDACKYSHDATPNSKTTGNAGRQVSELDQLRKQNAVLTQGAHDLVQMLSIKDPSLVAQAQQQLGQSLEKRSVAFMVSMSKPTADDQ